MKINGKKASVNVVTEIFVREGQEPIVFVCRAITDADEFTKYVPEPTPPLLRKPGEEVATPDFTDLKYVKEVTKYNKLQTYWMILKSIEGTPGLEWEHVKYDDPTTWSGIDEELKDFGLSGIEKTRLINAVRRANSLDEAFLAKAKERFMFSQQATIATPTSSQ